MNTKVEKLQDNKRIAKNVIYLYIRMFFLMCIQLYTSRVVLNTLGVEDYGIYNVVGGIVTFFAFINSAMINSTQRYLTFELAKNNIERLKTVFNTSLNIHFIISLVVIVLGETVGLWFLCNKMTIPDERMVAAIWVYQLSILTTVITITSFPYNATIIAHEKMSAFAYISVVEAVLKLVIVYILMIGDYDKLIIYAVLVACVQLTVRFVYTIYCKRKFEEAHYSFMWDKSLFKDMMSFAGWSLWGNTSLLFSGQGLNMLLNIFFGPSVNAARAISVQIHSAIQQFSQNFMMALSPQITKTYSSGQIAQMHLLVYRSSKVSYLLLFVLCLPVFFEAPTILHYWLKIVPDYTVIFLRLMIMTLVIDAMAQPLMVSASATGNIKRYQATIGGMLMMILPISYVVLKCGGAPWSVFVVHLAMSSIAFIARMYIIRPLIDLSIGDFMKKVCLKCAITTLVALIIPVTLKLILPSNLLMSILTMACSILSACTCVLFIGLDNYERTVIKDKMLSKLFKGHSLK